jgi:hypothetical protein
METLLRDKQDARSMGKWQGMNWIRQEKRLAIYLRDGLSCAYCGESVEDGAKLTLDHLVCHSQGGSNNERNLVTCCHRCNSVRAARPLEEFAKATALYLNHGITAKEIIAHVRDCTARPLDKAGAKEMIARRGSAAKALAELR